MGGIEINCTILVDSSIILRCCQNEPLGSSKMSYMVQSKVVQYKYTPIFSFQFWPYISSYIVVHFCSVLKIGTRISLPSTGDSLAKPVSKGPQQRGYIQLQRSLLCPRNGGSDGGTTSAMYHRHRRPSLPHVCRTGLWNCLLEMPGLESWEESPWTWVYHLMLMPTHVQVAR